MDAPTLADIEAARARIAGVARETPVFGSETLSRMAGREVRLKAENLQRTGSFKLRGALNKVSTLDDAERAAGVVAASAGNHGQAVAWAARQAGVAATIFMPQDSPMAKVEASRGYGAQVELVGEAFEASMAAAQTFAGETGATIVHAFDDPAVVAGQGTLGLELAAQLDTLGTVVIPVGGGGLAAGVAIALRALRPEARLVGVQAERCAPLAGGTTIGFTIAEGIAVKQPGALTAPILAELLDDVVAVSEEEISETLVLLAERSKLVVEGAGAAALAALLAGRVGGGDGPALAILSGGNIDATLLISVLRHGLTHAGRSLVVRSRVPDRPGELIQLLQLIAAERVNIVSVEHHREGMDIPIGETEVELTLMTRDQAHCDELLDLVGQWGYPVERVR
ncbi:MAG: threonine dehydratase [Gaiellaceae bacterium]|nr:threonine dehydratase [Gaiellaceae bacterium]